MIRTVFVIILLFLTLGCQQTEDSLPEEKMVAILTDMLILDELLVKYGGSDPEGYRDSLKMMILERHDLKITQFDSTMTEVQKDLKAYHEMQSKVADNLDSMKKEIEMQSLKKKTKDQEKRQGY